MGDGLAACQFLARKLRPNISEAGVDFDLSRLHRATSENVPLSLWWKQRVANDSYPKPYEFLPSRSSTDRNQIASRELLFEVRVDDYATV